ncbi:hypothetical protein A2U01_0105581, partial [Trifolium medium]|nr:hypothetical protein [Trifolium medium]
AGGGEVDVDVDGAGGGEVVGAVDGDVAGVSSLRNEVMEAYFVSDSIYLCF